VTTLVRPLHFYDGRLYYWKRKILIRTQTQKKLVDSQHMGASTLNLLALLEERESTQEREGERTLEDPPKRQEQETDREEEKDEVLGPTWSTTGSFDATSGSLHTRFIR